MIETIDCEFKGKVVINYENIGCIYINASNLVLTTLMIAFKLKSPIICKSKSSVCCIAHSTLGK